MAQEGVYENDQLSHDGREKGDLRADGTKLLDRRKGGG